MDRADLFIEAARKEKAFVFDCEHPPELSFTQPGFRLAGVSFATEGMEFYSTDKDEYTKIIQTLFPEEVEAIAFNLKYDLKCLTAVGICDTYSYPLMPVDPMIEVNLLDENRKLSEMGLKIIVYDQFGYTMMTFEEAWKYGEHSKEFADYSTDDARWEFKLHKVVKPKIEAENLWQLFTKILMPVVLVFADMEMVGVGWDIDYARHLLRGFQELRTQFEKKIYEKIGQIDLGSNDKIARRLFEELGYPTKGLAMTKTGKRVAVDAEAMDKLSRKFPVCDDIVKWRTCSKMISTYVEPITREALDDPNQRSHGTFWPTSTTGRIRCTDPNWQNIPAWLDELFHHLNIRKGVITKPGWKMIVADQSQIELRLCGHITEDPRFLAAYRNWKCGKCGSSGSEISQILHVCPKCGNPENEGLIKSGAKHVPLGFWHGEDLHQQTTENIPALKGNRQYGKATNFALIYYATCWRMHYEHPALSPDEWELAIQQFMNLYKGVRRWHLVCEREMYRTGKTSDLFGRQRRIPKHEISRNTKHSLNQFINFPVQASACNLLLHCQKELRKRWLKKGAWMRTILQSNFVHDEGVWECPEEYVDEYKEDIRDVMENSIHFKVPLRTSILVVDRWGEAKGA